MTRTSEQHFRRSYPSVSTFVLLAALLLTGLPALAQGTRGTLTGIVTAQGEPLPGVVVTISSPSMQGTRVTFTNENGAYNFPAIPPGTYEVTFEMQGLSPNTHVAIVSLATTARLDTEMRFSTAMEEVTVTASAPSALETTAVSANFTAETIDNLPVARSATTEVTWFLSTALPSLGVSLCLTI